MSAILRFLTPDDNEWSDDDFEFDEEHSFDAVAVDSPGSNVVDNSSNSNNSVDDDNDTYNNSDLQRLVSQRLSTASNRCSICFDDDDESALVCCERGDKFCKQCIDAFVRAELKSQSALFYRTVTTVCPLVDAAHNNRLRGVEIKRSLVESVRCPGLGCTCLFTQSKLKSLLPKQTLLDFNGIVSAQRHDVISKQQQPQAKTPFAGLEVNAHGVRRCPRCDQFAVHNGRPHVRKESKEEKGLLAISDLCFCSVCCVSIATSRCAATVSKATVAAERAATARRSIASSLNSSENAAASCVVVRTASSLSRKIWAAATWHVHCLCCLCNDCDLMNYSPLVLHKMQEAVQLGSCEAADQRNIVECLRKVEINGGR